MRTLWQDLKFGARMLARTPSVTLLAIATLALGIGANSAVFTVVYGVLLRPLPFTDAERLVALSNTIPAAGVRSFPFSQPELFEHRTNNSAFEAVAAYIPANLNLTGGDAPERIAAARVSANFLDVLGAAPALGRVFPAEADQPGAERVVLLSRGFWQRYFAADRAAIGQSLMLDGTPHAVIGVLPPDFRFPATAELWVPAVFAPQASGREGLGRQMYRIVARMKPGVTREQAGSSTDAAARHFYRQYPDFYSGSLWKITLAPLREQIVGDISATLAVLMGAVGLILLIACANLSHLLLGRFLAREKELVVRTALGAGRARLANQLLAECALLGIAGGAVGLAAAGYAVDLLVALNPGDIPRAEAVRVDGAVLAFTLVVSLLVSLLFGVAPAWRAAAANPADYLRQMGDGARRSSTRFRDGLVVSEIALAFVLLVGAGLLARTLANLASVPPGIATENRLTIQISPPSSRYPDAAHASALFAEIVERAAALPGVDAVGGVSALPLSGQDNRAAFSIEGWTPEQQGKATSVHYRFVTPGYFRAAGIPLLRGRTLAESDTREAPLVALVNQTFAQRFWPDSAAALGHRVSFDRGVNWYTVAGVVADVKHYGLAADTDIEIFIPYAQATSFFAPVMTLVMQSAAPAESLMPALRARIAEVDPALPIHNVRAMDEVLAASLARPRFQVSLTGIFAALGLLLAAVGAFSVLSQTVTQRRREVGIRLALGAQPREVRALFVRHGMRLALAGIAVGATAALGLMRLVKGLLFGVEPADPASFALAIAILLSAATLACWLPARRATRVDPMIVLRHE
ncbi:MAG: ABC transporter permease [Candidatus Acidiferrales bacterium]